MARQKRQPCAQTDALTEKLGQTILRLRTADKMSLAIVAQDNALPALVAKAEIKDTPGLFSEDGLCKLRIIGSVDTVQFAQWYDFTAEIGGKLISSPHPAGSVENLSVLKGELRISVGDAGNEESWSTKAGETLRYRADRPHKIENIGNTAAHATMVNILAHAIRTIS